MRRSFADAPLAELRRRIGRLEQIAGIVPFTLSAGRGAGVRALELRTLDGLRAVFVVDRAMDLLSLDWRGVPLAWQSQNGVAAPSYYRAEGDEFLRTFFGGMLTTCGLTNFGPASRDRYGTVGLHGAINHVPAEDYCFALNDEGEPACFEIRARMRETRVFGDDLRLERSWRVPLAGGTVELRDRIVNEAAVPAPHMVLYHCNAGFPLVSEHLRLYLSHSAMHARDSTAQRAAAEWDLGGPPDAKFEEQVFVHAMEPVDDGKAVALFANEDLGLGLALRFSAHQLPYAFTWRMLGERTYVMAVEPANCPTIAGREAAIREGTLPLLQPGEGRTYDVTFNIIGEPGPLADLARSLAAARTP